MSALIVGDAQAALAGIPDASIQCCITSPPYWGLRDYGVAGQLGLEATPAEYVERMVAVFREVRRALRDDGTLWLNLGDSYTNNHPNPHNDESRWAKSGLAGIGSAKYRATLKSGTATTRPKVVAGLKNKDLVGIPWRVAFALQADGWYLRSDIIWAKPNPMPESVTDRPTKSHEYLFLLSKSATYYYDQEAIRESTDAGSEAPLQPQREGQGDETSEQRVTSGQGPQEAILRLGQRQGGAAALSPDREGPSQLSAGSSQAARTNGDRVHAHSRGVGEHQAESGGSLPLLRGQGDPDYGSQRPAVEGRTSHGSERGGRMSELQQQEARSAHMVGTPRNDGDRWREVDGGVAARGSRNRRTVWTVATQPYSEAHFATMPPELVRPCILAGSRQHDRVLDPFAGAGTVWLVANRLQRYFVGVELNPAYAEMARRRVERDAPLFMPANHTPQPIPLSPPEPARFHLTDPQR